MSWWRKPLKQEPLLPEERKPVRFIWGFPVQDPPGKDDSGKPAQNRGVAMIIAIMAAAMMMLFSVDLILNSSVSLQLATSARNNIKAEYLAKSGLNLSVFLSSIDLAVDVFKSTPAGGGAIPGDGRESDDIWAIVNQLPPLGGETAEMLETFSEDLGLSKVNDAGVLDQLKTFDGVFTPRIEDESSRININNCAVGRGDICLLTIKGLMSCPAEAEFLTKKNLEADQLAANIKDWADNKTTVTEGASDSTEEGPYEDRKPAVAPKNDRFDSLEELKVVAGWDDDLHKVFAPYLTVFPFPDLGNSKAAPRVNFNTASLDFLNCLLKAYDNCPEKAVSWTNKESEEDASDTARSAQQISQFMDKYFCSNDKESKKMFTYRSDTFRVKVEALVGDQEKVLEAVIYRYVPNRKEQAFSTSSYKLLYWKML